MNKNIYLGPLGNRDTLDTPYSVMGSRMMSWSTSSCATSMTWRNTCLRYSWKSVVIPTRHARSPAGLRPTWFPTPVWTG
ncbi:hypothetical protein RAA17_21685 [Komagataeibacter rhaeticus]|nr:hypothetical protein [Komagataeibacter rhaeticus]